MKKIYKFICLSGAFLIIILSLTFFSCKNSEKNIILDNPVQFKLKIDASEKTKIKIEEDIEYYSEISENKILLSCYALAYADKVVEDNSFDNTYPNGFSKGEVKVEKIVVDGKERDFSLDFATQTICVNNKVEFGDKININIRYELSLPNVKHRLGYFNGFYSLSHFYPYVTPVKDGKYSPRPYSPIGEVEFLSIANFEIELVIPSGNVLVHTGVMESYEQGEVNNKYYLKASSVRDFSAFWSKNLTMMSRKVGNTTLKYYFSNDTTPTIRLDDIEKALTTFSEVFGEYGHDNLSVVLAPVPYAGMEYSEIALVSNELAEKARKEVIVHEIAHQWWYMKVATDQAFSPWLDESLAEFSTALFYLRNNEGQTFEKFRQYGLSVLENRIISNQPYAIKGAIYDFSSSAYSECVYTIGSLMWINYYSIKGPALLEDLKNYATKFENKKASESDLSSLVFKGYETMLSGWLDGKVII